MNIVCLNGRLGNQLFCYALYKKLQTMGMDAYMYTNVPVESCQIDIFDLDIRWAQKEDVVRLYRDMEQPYNTFEKYFYKYLGKRTYVPDKNEMRFTPSVLKYRKEAFYNGFWQCEKYFSDIKEELRKVIVFPEIEDSVNKNIQNEINRTEESVSVHLRLGDYVTIPKTWAGVCTDKYYRDSISYMRNHLNKPHFYVFSNDIEMAKSILGENTDYTYVEGNDEANGYIDMNLMSQCKHQIIANSSFSWWAAYLNKNNDKIVIAPDGWCDFVDNPEIVCSDWIKIKG